MLWDILLDSLAKKEASMFDVLCGAGVTFLAALVAALFSLLRLAEAQGRRLALIAALAAATTPLALMFLIGATLALVQFNAGVGYDVVIEAQRAWWGSILTYVLIALFGMSVGSGIALVIHIIFPSSQDIGKPTLPWIPPREY